MTKKKLLIIISVIIFFIILSIFITGNSKAYYNFYEYKTPYEKENNNTFSDANFIKLNSNIYGKINKNGDEDYYYFYNNDIIKKVVNIYVTDINLKDLYITIYNENKEKLLSTPNKKIINLKIPPKTKYYIKIFNKNNKSSNIDYNLIVNIIKNYNKFIELEPDNDFDKANPISLDNTINGTSINYDKDFYKLKITDSNFFSISVIINNNPINLNIYSKDHLKLYSLNNLKKSIIISPLFLTRGIYYIELSSKNTKYSIIVSKSQWAGEVEFNNNKDSSNEFSLNDKIEGSIGWANDIDFYKVYIKKEGIFNFYFNKNVSSSIIFILINENNKNVKKTTFKDFNNFLELKLNKGYYYLKFETKAYFKPIIYSFRMEK